MGFGAKDKAKDTQGEVHEYFLVQFASAEGKKVGHFYTPARVVKVLVEVLSPHKGKFYAPCRGSGGMFVQPEKFVESHGGRFGEFQIIDARKLGRMQGRVFRVLDNEDIEKIANAVHAWRQTVGVARTA
jgi:type I restriction-modification system DNA methylase subunit